MTVMTSEIMDSSKEIERPCSPDIMLGTYLISHLRHFCENCGTLETPQWRKGWYSELLKRSVLLCNACGLKYHKNQYCPYCRYVYGKEEEKANGHWLTCQSCGRWVHMECEIRFESFMKNMNFKREEILPLHESSYTCPNCRKENSKTGLSWIGSSSPFLCHNLKPNTGNVKFNHDSNNSISTTDMSLQDTPILPKPMMPMQTD